ncbi:MAG: N-6 DNA methylase [Bacteroidales bacterium]|nr:N-6 DNA methylase [Bacteroidales bacterium]
MENISWSEEQVLAVVNEFNDAMESIRVKHPEFQHVDFVKLALLYLKREHISSDWQLTEENDKAAKILKHLDFDLSDNTSELKTNGIELKKVIQQVYSDTIGRIPYNEYAKNYLEIVKKLYKNVFSRGSGTHSPLDSYFDTIHDEEVPYQELFVDNCYGPIKKYPGRVIYIKGFDTLLSLMFEEINGFWDNTITCDFDNLDDLYFFEMLNSDIEMKSYGTTLLFGPKISEKNLKYDIYLDYDFDFSRAPYIFEKLNTNGYIIAGVSDTEIDGKNEDLRRLFDNGQVQRVHFEPFNDDNWVKLVPSKKQSTDVVDYYDPHNSLMYHEIQTEDIVKYGYFLDLAKYDVLEKNDKFLNIIDSSISKSSIGYEEVMALLFLIPYFKNYYSDTLSSLLVEDYDPEPDTCYVIPDYWELKDQCDNDFLKIEVINAFNHCITRVRNEREYFTDAFYQNILSAIRMIDSIDSYSFQKYYSEVVERIYRSVFNTFGESYFSFVQSQINNDNKTKITIINDNPEFCYNGWDSLLLPSHCNNQDIEMLIRFEGDAICSAAQYVIFDAFNQQVSEIGMIEGAQADIIVDLYNDVRQYEYVSKLGLRPGGRYVTFAMKKDMGECQPVIEHLIKENLLEKIISLNNRYLLFISQSKQDDKVVLAKFNHVDDERWLESYQNIIDELALNADSKHVGILSLETLAANNYSVSTDHYFTPDTNPDIKADIQAVVSLLRNKYNTKDILLNIMLRIATLRNEGKPFSVANWDNVKKLNDVLASMKESEEILLEHYTECLDFIMEIYGSDSSSQEFYQPEVAKLMADLIESDTVHKLYNPFAGLASFACLFPHSNYYGDEIDESVFSFGSFHLDAKGLLEPARYTCGDSFQFFKQTKEELFDTILTIPPFLPKKETTLYDFLFNECMDHLEENGKMTVVLPAGFTFNRSLKTVEIRKKIVRHHWVEKVISLPGGTFRGTNVYTCIIRLSKCANTDIVFCDATQLVEKNRGKVVAQYDAILAAAKNNDETCCFSIPYSSINKDDYSLSPITYKPILEQDGTTTYKLGELLTRFKRETVSVSEGLVLGADMLSSDVVEYRRDLSDLKMEPVNDMMIPLHGEALLLSPIQGTLRPTYVEVSKSTCYYLKNNLLAFKVDTAKVLPAYICYALTRPEVSHQIDNYRAGLLINSEDLLNVWINLPEITTQRNIVGELARQRYAEKKQELSKLSGNVYVEKEEEFKSLKHAMGKSRAGISASVNLLFDYLEDTGQLNNVIDKTNLTPGDVIAVIKQSLKHIEDLLKYGADPLDPSKYPLCYITIKDVWDKLNYHTDKFILSKPTGLDESVSDLNVKVNLTLFETLINDIMSNAEQHAFEDCNPINNVNVEYTVDNEWFTLFISNNGKPFPKDIDVVNFTKRGWAAGSHKGSGIGGNDIKTIIEDVFNGHFELLTEYSDSYPTCYVLRFPIE